DRWTRPTERPGGNRREYPHGPELVCSQQRSPWWGGSPRTAFAPLRSSLECRRSSRRKAVNCHGIPGRGVGFIYIIPDHLAHRSPPLLRYGALNQQKRRNRESKRL